MRQLKIQKSITNRSSEALDKYLVEIGRAPLISIDEEIELAQKIRKGGSASSKPHRNLMKHVVLNSSLTPFGGFARAFCRLLLSRVVLFVCP